MKYKVWLVLLVLMSAIFIGGFVSATNTVTNPSDLLVIGDGAIDDCTTIDGWYATLSGLSVSLNTTTFYTNNASLNLIKTSTSTSSYSQKKDIYVSDIYGKDISYYLYIKDATVLAKIDNTDYAAQLGLTDSNGNYVVQRTNKAYLNIGWNEIEFNDISINDISTVTILISLTGASITLAEGELLMDNWKSDNWNNYNWLLDYTDTDYNSELVYKYSLGIDTDQNLETGTPIYWDVNQYLNVVSVDTNYFALPHELDGNTYTDIYSFVDVNKYIKSYITLTQTGSNYPSATYGSNTTYNGVKILGVQDSMIRSIDKNNLCTATKVYVYNTSGTLLDSTSFVGDTATFTPPLSLSQQYYYVVAGSDGASFQNVYDMSPSFPYSNTHIFFMSGASLAGGWFDRSYSQNITNIDVVDYYDLNFISSETIFSDDNFSISNNVYNADITNPAENELGFLFPNTNYDWMIDYNYYLYRTEDYNFGVNDTNSLDGTETQLVSSSFTTGDLLDYNTTHPTSYFQILNTSYYYLIDGNCVLIYDYNATTNDFIFLSRIDTNDTVHNVDYFNDGSNEYIFLSNNQNGINIYDVTDDNINSAGNHNIGNVIYSYGADYNCTWLEVFTTPNDLNYIASSQNNWSNGALIFYKIEDLIALDSTVLDGQKGITSAYNSSDIWHDPDVNSFYISYKDYNAVSKILYSYDTDVNVTTTTNKSEAFLDLYEYNDRAFALNLVKDTLSVYDYDTNFVNNFASASTPITTYNIGETTYAMTVNEDQNQVYLQTLDDIISLDYNFISDTISLDTQINVNTDSNYLYQNIIYNSNIITYVEENKINKYKFNDSTFKITTALPDTLTRQALYSYISVDGNTFWSDDTFDVNYSRFTVQFFDENTCDTLDGNVIVYDSTNSQYLPVDENGYMEIWLEDYNITEPITGTVERKVGDTVTHTQRQFNPYLSLFSNHDINMALLPVNEGTYIEFIGKSATDELWSNRYIYAQKINGNNLVLVDESLTSNYTTELVTNNIDGVQFEVLSDVYLNRIYFENDGVIQYTKAYLYDYDTEDLLLELDINTDFDYVALPLLTELTAGKRYSITFDNDGANYRSQYTNGLLSSPVTGTYIEYQNGCANSPTTCISTRGYNLIKLEVFEKCAWDMIQLQPYASLAITDASGLTTMYLDTDGNYQFLYINGTGSVEHIYQMVETTVLKPKDEITLVDISPYDVIVGGLLNISDTNVTDSNITFNMFPGTTQSYSVIISDYNATPLDREYIPRIFELKMPTGSDYESSYILQPYLLTEDDGVVPVIYVVDEFERALPEIDMKIYRYINTNYTLVSQQTTDDTGKVSFSAYPLESYYVQLYYEGTLKNIYKIVPRESTDTFYLILNLIGEDPIANYLIMNVDLNGTEDYYTYGSDIDIGGYIKTNIDVVTGYTLELYQNDMLIDSVVVNETGVMIDIDQTLAGASLDTNYPTADIYLTVNYIIDGDSISKQYKKTIFLQITGSLNLFKILKDIPNDFGHLLSILLAILCTVGLVAGLRLSGMPLDITSSTFLGLFILGIFMFLGWLDTGVVVFGFDTGKFLYILCVLFAFFMMSKRISD